MDDSVGFYLHTFYWYKYRVIKKHLAQRNITCTWKIYFQATTSPNTKVISNPSSKVWQVVLQLQCHVESAF